MQPVGKEGGMIIAAEWTFCCLIPRSTGAKQSLAAAHHSTERYYRERKQAWKKVTRSMGLSFGRARIIVRFVSLSSMDHFIRRLLMNRQNDYPQQCILEIIINVSYPNFYTCYKKKKKKCRLCSPLWSLLVSVLRANHERPWMHHWIYEEKKRGETFGGVGL